MPYKDLDAREACRIRSREKNKERKKIREKERYYADKEKSYWLHIKLRYGVSRQQYEEMLRAQDGRCAICRTVSDKRLNVDHCHTTQTVRSLLCYRCNCMIGFAKESQQILASAQTYLQVWDAASRRSSGTVAHDGSQTSVAEGVSPTTPA
jgi:hypothetical protein